MWFTLFQQSRQDHGKEVERERGFGKVFWVCRNVCIVNCKNKPRTAWSVCSVLFAPPKKWGREFEDETVLRRSSQIVITWLGQSMWLTPSIFRYFVGKQKSWPLTWVMIFKYNFKNFTIWRISMVFDNLSFFSARQTDWWTRETDLSDHSFSTL